MVLKTDKGNWFWKIFKRIIYRQLIEKFIQESLPNIDDTDTISEEFEKFWNLEQEKALKDLIKTESLSEEKNRKNNRKLSFYRAGAFKKRNFGSPD
ncbi:hypothetical protein FNO01nite_13970 [Flavobacterium noncentrifugens]|uniref:type I restriction endonuclease subunit R, EcoR124 family n=1 Tax=Flavobacterium noncentrifugens TaxID=1128970 RepID=UPI00118FE62A|nr:hypothetical protein [Flavobacterium noncentrifugens]GEP50725.1 hypothetical protein FNO01nite_13970 [Flavobacterium noncentrifugens]